MSSDSLEFMSYPQIYVLSSKVSSYFFQNGAILWTQQINTRFHIFTLLQI